MALTNLDPQAPWRECVAHIGPLTAAEFAQLPEADGWIYELHQGRVIRMPGPSGEHSFIQGRLVRLIGNHLDAQHLVEIQGTGCYYFALPTSEEILCPDISYIAPPKSDQIHYRGSYVATIPDLVIESAHRMTTSHRRNKKPRCILPPAFVWYG